MHRSRFWQGGISLDYAIFEELCDQQNKQVQKHHGGLHALLANDCAGRHREDWWWPFVQLHLPLHGLCQTGGCKQSSGWHFHLASLSSSLPFRCAGRYFQVWWKIAKLGNNSTQFFGSISSKGQIQNTALKPPRCSQILDLRWLGHSVAPAFLTRLLRSHHTVCR